MPSRRKGKKQPTKQNCHHLTKHSKTDKTPNKPKSGEKNRDQRAGTEKLHVSTKKIKARGSKILGEIEKIIKNTERIR